MAQTAGVEKRPSIVGLVGGIVLVLIVGYLAFQLITGIFFWIIQMLLILAAIYVIFRIGLYLLRKGR